MIPTFPNFKKLEIEDRRDIEEITKHHPPYSDFNFTSLWCWDVGKQVEISILNKNLVVRFSDYVDGDSFLSFIGTNDVPDTARRLLLLSQERGYGDFLELVPEDVVNYLKDCNEFSILESRDHYDYIYSVRDLKICKGGSYENIRRQVNNFNKCYPKTTVVQLDLNSSEDKEKIKGLDIKWKINKNMEVSQERSALIKCLNFSANLPLIAIGLKNESDSLIAFSISEVLEDNYALCHFAKADINYSGVYYRLMQEVIQDLDDSGVQYLNYEQDLGKDGLRMAKMHFKLHHFFKKYKIFF